MGATLRIGRLHKAKSHTIFVASPDNGHCPTMNITTGNAVKFRDDYSKGLNVPKTFTKLLFKH